MFNKKIMILFTSVLFSASSCEKLPFTNNDQGSVKSERFGMSRRMRHHDRRGENRDLERICNGLDLTEEQGLKIKEINEAFADRHLAVREELEPVEDMLRTELHRENVDLDKVKKILNEMSGPETRRRLLMIEHRIEVEKVLSPEQLKKARRFNRPFGRR